MSKKILIAMSGGVDSSMSAAMLTKQGNQCQGAFMITHDKAFQAAKDAQAVADKIGIKLHILDWRQKFEKVIDYFTDQYQHGRTPNPCVFCNRNIKFSGLYEFAKSLGLDYIATGHYCRVIEIEGKHYLYRSENISRDQSYALTMIDRSILEHLILPVGNKDKNDLRKIAAELGLSIADKPDSQEICFIPDNDYVAKLESRCPQLIRDGDVVDSDGKILGHHTGIHKYTIGQRRGLGIALGQPAYVVALDAKENKVILGGKQQLMHKKLIASRPNWLSEIPQTPFKAEIKPRYNDNSFPGMVHLLPDGNIMVEFDTPAMAITPGQAAVFYVDDQFGTRLVGGAWIDGATD